MASSPSHPNTPRSSTYLRLRLSLSPVPVLIASSRQLIATVGRFPTTLSATVFTVTPVATSAAAALQAVIVGGGGSGDRRFQLLVLGRAGAYWTDDESSSGSRAAGAGVQRTVAVGWLLDFTLQ